MDTKTRVGLLLAALAALGVTCWVMSQVKRVPTFPPARPSDAPLVRQHLLAGLCDLFGERSVESGHGSSENPDALLRDLLTSTSPLRARLAALVVRNYIPLIEGEEVIGGRQAYILRLKPKVKHRPWKQLLVDKKRHVVLASRDWSSYDRVKRSPHVSALPPGRLGPTQAGHIPQPRYLPPGYELVGERTNASDNSIHTVYSDGLNSISLFQRFPASRGGEQLGSGTVRDWGAGLILYEQRPARELAVVADLPARQLTKIISSVP